MIEIAETTKTMKKMVLEHFIYFYFFYRWPELRLVKPRSLSMTRAQAATPEAISKYYQELERVLTTYNIQSRPELIYNLDESGFSPEHSPPKIVTTVKGPNHVITTPRRDTTTLISCVNALGTALPPFLIFKGKRLMEDLLKGTPVLQHCKLFSIKHMLQITKIMHV